MTRSLDVLSTLFSLTQLSCAHQSVCAELPVADAEALVRYAYRECKNSPQGAAALGDLVHRAEQSGVPLSQWIAEIVAVYRWLESRQLRAALREIVEYVSCAQEGSGSNAGHNIEWYLDQYGFECARGITGA